MATGISPVDLLNTPLMVVENMHDLILRRATDGR